MKRPNEEEQRQLVRQWAETGRLLEQIRREELRGKPYDWKEVDALLSLADHYDGCPAHQRAGGAAAHLHEGRAGMVQAPAGH